ncbi:N-acetylmuramoyl-L-alanine amidase [Faecalimonas sp.]
MKKIMARWIALILAGVMITSSAGNVVSAKDKKQAKSEQATIVNQKKEDENQTANLKVEKSSQMIKNEFNYIYINEPQIKTGNEQKIVLSWGDNNQNVQDIKLIIEDERGKQITLSAKKKSKGLFLYEYTFKKGIYYVAGLKVITTLENKIFMADELDIDAYFGVGKQVDKMVKSQHIQMDSAELEKDEKIIMQDSIVTIESNNTEKIKRSVSNGLSTQTIHLPKNEKSITELRNIEKKKSNLVIVLDPGHDENKHAGASANGVREEIVTLKIANYCKEVLEKYEGVSVYMTRTDGKCPFPNSTSNIDDIKKRVEWAKTKGADVFVSFHINSAISTAAQGAEVYYPKGDIDAGNLAKNIVKELEKLGLKNRGDKANESYSVITNSKKNGFPGLIIEHAFLTNKSDVKWLQTEENLKKLGEADAAGIINHYGIKGIQEENWEFVNGHWKWKESNGKYVTSRWKLINKKWYYFDSNGNRVTGWQLIEKKWYYMNSVGVMQTGWQLLDGKWYYMDSSGMMRTGWQLINGKWYYMDSSGMMKTGWQLINGKWYYMNSSGVMQVGWQTINKQKYYFNEKGAMQIGWQLIENEKYYFHSSGYLLKGEQVINGKKWNLNKNTGILYVGLRLVDGKWYYYNETGFRQTGWQYINKKWYYMDGSGAMQTGWQYINKKWYYMDGSGVMQTGWQLIEKKWYYMNGSGAMQTGWQLIDKKWYYMNGSGAMQTGWQLIDKKWYYMDASGVMQVGWKTIGVKKYYFNGSGAMQTGWQFIDRKWYYFEQSGELNVNAPSEPPSEDSNSSESFYEISGRSSITVEQMIKYYKKSGKEYPTEALKVGGAKSIEEFCEIYYEECKMEGIKAEVAFTQAMIETGFLQFGGSVKIEQFNFAGLGAIEDGVSGNSFPNVRIGVRAHIQHLKCYANKEKLKNECVDPRWGEWLRGKAPYVEWLSIQNNPNGAGWANDPNYGKKILKGIQEMEKCK